MLTKTALRSPAFLARIKAAAVAAVLEANRQVMPSVIRGIGMARVNDRRGRFSLQAVFHTEGRALEFFDRRDNDVTAVVLEALRTWHAEQRAARPPLMLVETASAAEWSHAVMVLAIRRKHWRAERLANLQRIGE